MPLPEQVAAIQPRLMREEVYRTLRQWIVDGTLQPEEKLRDIELADRLSVSRMPVREALNQLVQEGFVEMAPNRWTRVTRIDSWDARRIYPIIWTLEPLAVELAGPHLSDAKLAEMALHNDELRSAIDRGDPIAASYADTAFHQVYVAAADNPELAKILADLKVKLRRLEVAYFGGSIVAGISVEEHAELLQALRIRDIELAGELIRRNWRQSFERIAASGQAEPVDARQGPTADLPAAGGRKRPPR